MNSKNYGLLVNSQKINKKRKWLIFHEYVKIIDGSGKDSDWIVRTRMNTM